MEETNEAVIDAATPEKPTSIALSADEWQAIAESLNLINLSRQGLEQAQIQLQASYDQLDARTFRLMQAKELNPLEYALNAQQHAFVKK